MVVYPSRKSANRIACVSGDTTNQLRLTALNLFVTHGYQAVGLRQIAQSMGKKPGYLYNRIEGKEYLLFELVYDFERELSVVIKQAISKKQLYSDKIKGFVSGYIGFSLLNRDLHTLAVRESDSLSINFREKINILRTSRFNLLKEIACSGKCGGGLMQLHCELACSAVISMLSGIMVDVQTDLQASSLQRTACELAIKMVVCPTR